MNKFFNKKRKLGKKGFTLIELIVVIAVIGILVLLAAPKFLGYTKNANVAALQADAKVLETAALMYNIKEEVWPVGPDITIASDSELGLALGLSTDATFSKLDDTKLANYVKGTKEPTSNYVLDTATGNVYAVKGQASSKNETWYGTSLKVDGIAAGGDVDGTYKVGDYIYATKAGTFQANSILDYVGSSKDVVIPESFTVNGDTYYPKEIAEAAFIQKGIKSVVIPNSITSIGDYAFSHNQLTSVTIPNSVTSIGDEVFRGNKLTSVTIPDNVTSIGRRAFYDNQLTSVIIPDSVTSIEEDAFSNNGPSQNSENITNEPYEGTWQLTGDSITWTKQ